jgi:AraC-like DNA-binding protein
MIPRSGSLSHFPVILHAERETQHRDDYVWDNRARAPAGTIVVQRTIRGVGLLEAAGGVREVGPGRAMIFAYGEPSLYRIGPPGMRPYELAYLVLAPRGGIGDLFAQIRADFGDIIRMEARGEAARLLDSVVRSFSAAEARDQLELAGRAYRLAIALYREQVSGTQGSDPVAYLHHLLHSQFRSPRNIKELTHDLPMTREHLTRSFHQRYGETPAALLRRLRLEHARLLAATSRMSAEEIAAGSGFSCARTLRRAYRAAYGMPLRSAETED